MNKTKLTIYVVLSLTLTIAFPTKQARDAALASCMEHGVSAGYDRLDHLLTTNDLAATT